MAPRACVYCHYDYYYLFFNFACSLAQSNICHARKTATAGKFYKLSSNIFCNLTLFFHIFNRYVYKNIKVIGKYFVKIIIILFQPIFLFVLFTKYTRLSFLYKLYSIGFYFVLNIYLNNCDS